MSFRVALLVLLQILVPAFLLCVAVDAYRGGFHGPFPRALILASGIWMVCGLALLALRRRPRVARSIANVNLLVVSAVLSFVVLEVAVSIIYPLCRSGVARMPRPPGLRVEFDNNSETIPGRVIKTVFSTNELGMRGAPLAASQGAYKVLAIGASATENLFLDDAMAWPYLLEKRLEQQRQAKVWVQNAGFSGHTAVDHEAMIRSNPVTPAADLLIILVGVNDLEATLAMEGRSTEDAVVRRSEEAFGLFPLYTRSAVYKFLKLFLLTVSGSQYYEPPAEFYLSMRAQRRSSQLLPLPSVDLGVREYGDRIRRIAAECKRQGKRCLFLTQPTIWRADLDAAETDSLWLGYIGPVERPLGYTSPVELAVAMDRYNSEMIRVAREAGFEVYDLAARLPKTRVFFYDDCHFTNAGSEMVASEIADYLRASGR